MKSILALLRLVLPVVLLFSLDGCGGGGGGGSGGGDAALYVTQQPASVEVEAGETARFTSAASIAGATVQWTRDGVPIAGANSPEYVLADVSIADHGAVFQANYASGGHSAATQSATLLVRPRFTITGADDVRVNQGSAATFTAQVTGRDPVFQWQRSDDGGASWADIPGATQTTYTTAPVRLADHGALLRLAVGKGGAQALSHQAYLQVRPRLSLLAGQLGGCGHADGQGDIVRLCYVTGMTLSGADTYLLEGGLAGFHVRKVAADGTVSTVAVFDGAPDTGGMATDAAGNLYVALPYSHVVKKVQSDGTMVDFAGSDGIEALVDGTGTDARFGRPQAMATDATGNLYVIDAEYNAIRKITPAGVVTTPVGASGSATAGLLNFPEGLAVAPNGDLIVADTGNHVIRRITQTGVASIVAGAVGVSDYVEANGGNARFARPRAVAVDGAGVIYVADSNNYAIRRIGTNGWVTTLAGNGTPGVDNGSGNAARFLSPSVLTFDNAGNLMVVDASGNIVRRVTTTGAVTPVAGTVGGYGSPDGTGAAAMLDQPGPAALGPNGTLYFIDGLHVRAVDPQGTVTTLVGSGYMGSSDGSGTAAEFIYLTDIVALANGDLLVADQGNCAIRRISGIQVTTFVGQLTVCGVDDGTGNAARFTAPRGLVLEPNGDLLVTDNSALRRVTPSGVVTTIAGVNGAGEQPIDGPLAMARIGFGDRIAVLGNAIYFIDYRSSLRKIEAGALSTPYIYGEHGIPPSLEMLVVRNGRIYAASSRGELGMLSFGADGRPSFVSMLPDTGQLTVRLGADPLLNRVNGLTFTADGRLLIMTERAILISD